MDAPANRIPASPLDALDDLRERLRDWARRARVHVTEDDLRHLGPMGVWETIRGFARQQDRLGDWKVDLSARDAEFVELIVDAARVVGRTWFRFEARGVHRVPPSGPVLLVGNHNGGIVAFDTVLTVVALWDHFGPDRAVNLLGHDLLAYDPFARRLAAKFGILRATPEAASQALRAGRIVVVYPGSDLDSWRPWRDRHRVQLGKRKGFVRVALRESVPVVPMVSVGTHEQFVVLSTGRSIARRLDLKRRLRSEAFPIVLALPWGLTSGFFPYLPLPAQTTLSFGDPLRFPYTPSDADRPEVLETCYRDVERSMQQMLSALGEGRLPVVGELRRLVPPSLARAMLRRAMTPAATSRARSGWSHGAAGGRLRRGPA